MRWRWARPLAAISLCFLASSCLGSYRTDPGNSLTNTDGSRDWAQVSVGTAESTKNWRGELPQPARPPQTLLVAANHRSSTDSPRQPKTETLLLLAQRCYETAGDASRDTDRRCEHYRQALQIYRQILKQEPTNELAQLGQARVYKKLGQPEQAIATLNQLLRQSPNNPAAWYELGMCYGSQHRWDEQIRCLKRACQLEPDNLNYATHLGLALARAQSWQEAEQQLLAAIGPARTYYYLALMAEHVGRTDLVARYAQAAVQFDSTLASQERFQRWLRTASDTRH